MLLMRNYYDNNIDEIIDASFGCKSMQFQNALYFIQYTTLIYNYTFMGLIFTYIRQVKCNQPQIVL